MFTDAVIQSNVTQFMNYIQEIQCTLQGHESLKSEVRPSSRPGRTKVLRKCRKCDKIIHVDVCKTVRLADRYPDLEG